MHRKNCTHYKDCTMFWFVTWVPLHLTTGMFNSLNDTFSEKAVALFGNRIKTSIVKYTYKCKFSIQFQKPQNDVETTEKLLEDIANWAIEKGEIEYHRNRLGKLHTNILAFQNAPKS